MCPFRMELQIIKMPKNVETKNIKGVNSRILKTGIIRDRKHNKYRVLSILFVMGRATLQFDSPSY